jgi:multiple sugar transport system permease protein
MKGLMKNVSLTGALFVIPYILLALLFMIYPILRGIYNSFFDFRFSGNEFVAFDNYRVVFTEPVYLTSIINTLLIVAVVIPALIFFGILISGSIFDKSKMYMSVIRSSFYLPVISSMVVMAIIYKFMLDAQTGIARYLFNLAGMEPINILGDSTLAMSVIIFLLFTMKLGQCIVLFVASMLGIPNDLIDALKIDGGSRFHLFRYILIPLTQPIVLFVFITQTAALLQAYPVIKLLTNGGPNDETTTMIFLLQVEAFSRGNFGSASALGVILFLITLVLISLRFITMAFKKGGNFLESH